MTPSDAARPAFNPVAVPGRAARYRNWLLPAGAGISALAGLIWIGLVLFPLMSWDVYETGRLLIVGLISAAAMAWLCNIRAYAKGKADGWQQGHDVGYQRGFSAARDFRVSTEPGTTHLWATRPLGFPHSGSHIYTTE